jgi:hypothetical protein
MYDVLNMGFGRKPLNESLVDLSNFGLSSFRCSEDEQIKLAI